MGQGLDWIGLERQGVPGLKLNRLEKIYLAGL